MVKLRAPASQARRRPGAAGSRSVRSRVVIVDGSLRPGSLSDGPLLSEAGEDSVQAGTVGGNKQGRDRLGFRRVWGGVCHVMGGQRRAKDEVAGVERPSQRERPARGGGSGMSGDGFVKALKLSAGPLFFERLYFWSVLGSQKNRAEGGGAPLHPAPLTGAAARHPRPTRRGLCRLRGGTCLAHCHR